MLIEAFFGRWHRSESSSGANLHAAAGHSSMVQQQVQQQEAYSNPFEQPPPPHPSPPPRRSSSSRMLHRSPRIRPDSPSEGYAGSTSRMPFRVSVLRAGGLLHTFGSRRNAAVYADSLNYEAMLALDENNVRRGVRKAALDRLHTKTAGRADAKCECHVCMEAFKRGQKVMALPCEHRFCVLCIQRWLHDHITCPVCRWEFPEPQTQLIKS